MVSPNVHHRSAAAAAAASLSSSFASSKGTNFSPKAPSRNCSDDLMDFGDWGRFQFGRRAASIAPPIAFVWRRLHKRWAKPCRCGNKRMHSGRSARNDKQTNVSNVSTCKRRRPLFPSFIPLCFEWISLLSLALMLRQVLNLSRVATTPCRLISHSQLSSQRRKIADLQRWWIAISLINFQRSCAPVSLRRMQPLNASREN